MRTNRKNKKMERIILGALMFSGTMLAAPAWALADAEVPEVKVVSPTDLAGKVTDQTLKKEGLDLTGTKYLYALNPANTPKKLIIDSNDSFVDYPAESSFAAGFNSAGTAAVSGYKLEITRYPMLTYTPPFSVNLMPLVMRCHRIFLIFPVSPDKEAGIFVSISNRSSTFLVMMGWICAMTSLTKEESM